MPVTVYEKPESRRSVEGDDPGVELVFGIEGTDDDLAAKTYLLWASPLIYDGLVRQGRRIEPTGPDTWDGFVSYGRRDPKQTGESTWQFETSGGTQHITQSLATVGKYAPPGKMAADFRGAIGVTHDSVEGVDNTVPVYSFSETHYLPAAIVTGAYKAALFALTGRVNGTPFRGFAPGEVLFLGAAGSLRSSRESDPAWEVTFKFAASPNVTGLSVGDIQNIAKRGWEFLWIRYQDSDDPLAKILVKKPIAAYVEQVYPYGDFTGLGIGA